MMQIVQNYLRRRQRAKINRKLDQVYAGMRTATEQAKLIKRAAEQEEAETLARLGRVEQRLVAKAKNLDAHEMFQTIPTRSARSW